MKEELQKQDTPNRRKLVTQSLFWLFCSACIVITAFLIWAISSDDMPKLTKEKLTSEAQAGTGIEPTSAGSGNEAQAPGDSEKEFIDYYHDIFNELAGWGAIHNPDWASVHSQASNMAASLETLETNDPLLQQDFEKMKRLAKELSGQENKRALRDLHRYVHDLDMVVNGDAGANNYFRITAYGQANRQ